MKIKINDEIIQNISDIELGGGVSLSNLISNILLQAHPVGSYYWSDDSTSPATLFGGTWEQIKDKFVIAVGDSHTVGTSYGSNTKTISTDNLPIHSHSIPNLTGTAANVSLVGTFMHTGGDEGMCSGIVSHISGGTAESSIGYTGSVTKHQIDASHSHTITTNTSSTGTSGNGRAFDVTPACIAAYCWKRTA